LYPKANTGSKALMQSKLS